MPSSDFRKHYQKESTDRELSNLIWSRTQKTIWKKKWNISWINQIIIKRFTNMIFTVFTVLKNTYIVNLTSRVNFYVISISIYSPSYCVAGTQGRRQSINRNHSWGCIYPSIPGDLNGSESECFEYLARFGLTSPIGRASPSPQAKVKRRRLT